MINRRNFLGKLAKLPVLAALIPSLVRNEQEPVILENASIAAAGNTEEGSELVFGDYSTLNNCVIYADRVIMGRGSTILDSEVSGRLEMI